MELFLGQREHIEPADFVIATGRQHSVREGKGRTIELVGVVDSVADQSSTAVKPGDIIVRVDRRGASERLTWMRSRAMRAKRGKSWIGFRR